MMKKCTNTSQEESNFLFAKKENEDCQNVPAMRCKIEKRKVSIYLGICLSYIFFIIDQCILLKSFNFENTGD